jgi:hypothetical protein
VSISSISPRYGTIAEFGRRYGPGRTMAYELLATGKIVAVKLGRKTLVDFASADQYFAGLPRVGGSAESRTQPDGGAE